MWFFKNGENTGNVLSTIKALQTYAVSISEVAFMCGLNEPYVMKIVKKSISVANRLPSNQRAHSARDENYRFLRNASINRHTMILTLDPNALEIRTKLGDFVDSLFGRRNKQIIQPHQSQPQQIVVNVNQSIETRNNHNKTTPSFCSHCGSRLNENVNTCPNCGVISKIVDDPQYSNSHRDKNIRYNREL